MKERTVGMLAFDFEAWYLKTRLFTKAVSVKVRFLDT